MRLETRTSAGLGFETRASGVLLNQRWTRAFGVLLNLRWTRAFGVLLNLRWRWRCVFGVLLDSRRG